MPTQKPVVVYGASGFSGRLIAEFLREYNVPFLAAGRNRAKIQDVMNHVPGIETADYEIAEITGSADDLARGFEGAKVVCNTAGPFIYHGHPVLEACLKAGCHYLDIGGVQAWLRDVSENWGPKFAAQGLLVAPATAYMSTPSDIGVRLCLEQGAIDSFEIVTMFNGIPTFGSTQTIFAALQTDAYYLEQNRYKPWPRAVSCEVVVPGSVRTQLALPWGGFPHPVWYKNHPQIANVRTVGGIFDRQVMTGVVETEKFYDENIRPLPPEERERKLAEMASSVQAGTPPRENTREQRTVDVIAGRGTTDSAQCVILGTGAYRQTGLLQAYAAHNLIHQPPRKVGFASAAEAFGHRELLHVLESHGLSKARMV
jgi:short subunit dehydrogenase-like uncharacterized protein